jgi:hypothetical protein
MTDRYINNQTVLRLAPGYQRAGDSVNNTGMSQLASLLNSEGRGPLNIWLRMVMREVAMQEDGGRIVRENLRLYIGSEDFTAGQPVHFDPREAPSCVLCMFFLDRLLSTA